MTSTDARRGCSVRARGNDFQAADREGGAGLATDLIRRRPEQHRSLLAAVVDDSSGTIIATRVWRARSIHSLIDRLLLLLATAPALEAFTPPTAACFGVSRGAPALSFATVVAFSPVRVFALLSLSPPAADRRSPFVVPSVLPSSIVMRRPAYWKGSQVTDRRLFLPTFSPIPSFHPRP